MALIGAPGSGSTSRECGRGNCVQPIRARHGTDLCLVARASPSPSGSGVLCGAACSAALRLHASGALTDGRFSLLSDVSHIVILQPRRLLTDILRPGNLLVGFGEVHHSPRRFAARFIQSPIGSQQEDSMTSLASPVLVGLSTCPQNAADGASHKSAGWLGVPSHPGTASPARRTLGSSHGGMTNK